METNTSAQPDPQSVVCRVVDVNTAILNSFRRFHESDGKTLDDLAELLKDEMSKLELFIPAIEDGNKNG